jgi:hypothetical protein
MRRWSCLSTTSWRDLVHGVTPARTMVEWIEAVGVRQPHSQLARVQIAVPKSIIAIAA